MISLGQEQARVGPWRADGTVAFLVPVPGGGPASARFVRECLGALARQGYERVVTAALAPEEQQGFVEAGFGVREQLHLLVLDRATEVPAPPAKPRLRRARGRRKQGLLEVDTEAFEPFWRLDRAGLREALSATPRHRTRVLLGERGKVVGYAICGAAGPRGFVQRLGVLPELQGQGLGRRLLLDGVTWLRRVGTTQVAVNTQLGNAAALALYHQVGFRDEPDGLSVLSADLTRRALPR